MTTDVPHLSPDEFRARGHAVVDWIADYMAGVGELPIAPRVEPGWVRAQLPACAPEHPEPFEAVVADLDRVVVPGLLHWQSPGFFGFFPSGASGPSVLGDLVSSGLGVQGMLWATSPACTELESLVLDWMADALGLPPAFRTDGPGGGVIQDSASGAALAAIVAARHRAGGPVDALVAYTSTQAHSSIEKSARVAGIGHVRLVDVDDAFAMRPDALDAAIRADLAAGLRPFFVGATVGTTSSLAVDPVAALARVCRAYQTWLHVDAAMAGVAALCPEHRGLLDGVALADSFCTNPHKWLLTNFDCDLMWVADRAPLVQALSILPEYLRNAASESGAVIDYRDWGVPLGRRFRSLKLWFVLRHYGLEGLRAHLRAHIALGAWVAEQARSDDRFEVVAPPRLGLVCVALRAGDDATRRLVEAANATGRVYFTQTVLAGRVALRFSVGTAATQREHVEAAWSLLGDLATQVA